MIVPVPADRRCIVVGAGLLGLCSARSLAQRGWQVVVLEAAGTVGHERSGSKGDARIFRLGYPDPLYVEMACRARDLWRALEEASGRQLLHPRSQLTFGDDDALHAIEGALAAAGAPAERLMAADAVERFPGIELGAPALLEPHSGVLAADECLQALYATGGFELRTGAAVTAVHDRAGAAAVTTADGVVDDADVVVDCAGPMALELLAVAPTDGPAGGAADGPAVAARPTLPQVAYFAPRARSGGSITPPIFIEWGDDMIYGLPVPQGPRGGLYKVSHHTPGAPLDRFDPTDPVAIDDDPALLALLTGAVARLLPGLDPEPVASERCVYDNSADTDFVLDRLGHVVVGCGTSGHGFKFGPLLGELLADLAEGTRPAVDLGRFALGRRPAGGAPAAG